MQLSCCSRIDCIYFILTKIAYTYQIGIHTTCLYPAFFSEHDSFIMKYFKYSLMGDHFNLSKIYQFSKSHGRFCLHSNHSRMVCLLFLRIIVIEPLDCFSRLESVSFPNHLSEMISLKHSSHHVTPRLKTPLMVPQWLHGQVHILVLVSPVQTSLLTHPTFPLVNSTF